MKRRIRRSEQEYSIDCCALCKLNENCPDKYGEKITLKSHELTVHYFCLLMSSGVYQRGEENEGIYGFLVDDIKQEVSRSYRLKCAVCKKNGASVGCYVKSCRKMVHFPCGKQHQFIFQFTDPFPSYCKDHSPTQSLPVSSCVSEPLSCSVCLDPIEAVLSYSVLKCPACHGSWFHRDCVQNQAHSAAMFFFRCTLCNNKDMFQQEMLRVGIHIPERDAAWELEENAYGELLQVYQHCDANKCLSHSGRTNSSRTGSFQILRCMLCGSRGTHRKCASLNAFETDWACEDCAAAVDATGSLFVLIFYVLSHFYVLFFLALREDVYFDVGCLLSLSLIHGGPPLGFFSRALYQHLFNFPRDTPLTVEDMGNTVFADKVKKIQESKSLEELREAMQSASEYLEVAGCMRPVDSLSDKDALVEDIVSFHLITRMQLPFQRFCEGLKTLGVFDQVQMFPGAFASLFCSSPDKLTAETMSALFTVKFSEQEETTGKEIGRCATSLEDVLIYATSTDVVPAIGFSPNPTLSFLNPLDPAGAFPESQPSSNHLVLPVVPSYQVFKKNMEYAVCQLTVMQAI
uniref:G2/M-phase specific E3 ubiquitin protein ligase n=1 Tax=Hucho hucho TaxID=62062 RepID=A0A4W5N1J6_9TELE